VTILLNHSLLILIKLLFTCNRPPRRLSRPGTTTDTRNLFPCYYRDQMPPSPSLLGDRPSRCDKARVSPEIPLSPAVKINYNAVRHTVYNIYRNSSIRSQAVKMNYYRVSHTAYNTALTNDADSELEHGNCI
jgi:hypothetical protein